MIKWILLALLAIIVLLLLIAITRTLCLKPTSAVSAKIPKGDSERSLVYGQKLSKMIQCETVSHRDQEDRSKFDTYHKLLFDLFPKVKNTCEYHELNGSILLKWKGQSSTDPILLMSHQDVVPAGDGWEHAPFGGEIVDGDVWGRGTVDTKGSFFCIMQSVEELIADGFTPKTDIYIASSCTEEWSGDGGPATAKWLEDNHVHLRMLVDEGGMIIEAPIQGVSGIYAMVGVLEKGYGDVKFTAKGKGGHASAPGRNTPWARLAAFINQIEHKNPFKVEINDTVREMFRRLSPNMSFPMRMLFSNLWLFKGLIKILMPAISPAGAALMRTTIAFTKGSGSEGYNVLPEEAYVTANMRFIPHQPTKESIDLVTNIAKKYDIETSIIYAENPCPIVSYSSPEFAILENAVHKLYPDIAVSPYAMTGGTDAKYYSKVCDNCLRFAPLYINAQQYSSIHGKNENISTWVLPAGVDIYKEIIRLQ